MRTKRLVTAQEYGKCAAEFPNLVATKNATDSAERIEALMDEAPQLQHFFTEMMFDLQTRLDPKKH
jgi:dihydrodipicolinate synthase/N-acetylneuraminate lyase